MAEGTLIFPAADLHKVINGRTRVGHGLTPSGPVPILMLDLKANSNDPAHLADEPHDLYLALDLPTAQLMATSLTDAIAHLVELERESAGS